MLFAFNKQRILIYLYSKSWSRRFFNEEYIDKDKHFDAFISYSHEDREYVEQTLLTGLEEATDSEFRYKVGSWAIDNRYMEQFPVSRKNNSSKNKLCRCVSTAATGTWARTSRLRSSAVWRTAGRRSSC